MQSLKSNALEPTRAELATLSRGQAIVRVLPVYGLPILTILLIGLFSLLLPDSFPTAINARSILSDKGIIALLSLAAMVPMMAGRIDLTVGFGIVMWHILAITLQVQYGVPWPLACLLVMLCAGGAGLINGILVEVAQIDSFIATLGTGTILYALALWHTDGRQVIGELPQGFVDHQRPVDLQRADAGGLCAGAGGRALDRHRADAARPPPLRDRRQREGGGAQRHSGSRPCHRRVRRVGTARGLHRLRARVEAADRPGECRPRLPPAGAGRAPFSDRPRSGPDASTCGAQSSAS